MDPEKSYVMTAGTITMSDIVVSGIVKSRDGMYCFKMCFPTAELCQMFKDRNIRICLDIDSKPKIKHAYFDKTEKL